MLCNVFESLRLDYNVLNSAADKASQSVFRYFFLAVSSNLVLWIFNRPPRYMIVHEIFVIILFAQNPLLKAHTVVSGKD